MRVVTDGLTGNPALRTRDEVGRFLDGVDLVEPGLIQLHRWRPGPEDPVPDDDIANYGAVGRKR